MAEQFTEVLESTKSSKNSAMTWTPGKIAGCGVLVVHMQRVSTTYTVNEFRTDWTGRGFRLEKVEGGSDKEETAYNVFCSRDGSHVCDCKGFYYGKGKPCKHINAVLALIENQWV
jgi:hypothetical protein